MPAFDLPNLSPDAKPEFTDAKSCAAWLQTIPLASAAACHGLLLSQLETLNRFALAPGERLRILELLAEPAAFVQAEHAKKFTGKPVPLARVERETFHGVVALWDALSRGYQHCLNAIAEGDPELSGQTALVCQRALWCTSQRMAEHHKSVQEIGGSDWRLLYLLYAMAEGRRVHQQELANPAQRAHRTSCLQTFAGTLLLYLANESSEQSAKRLAVVSRWLERWASKAGIGNEPPASELGVPRLAVDLASECGPTHSALTGESVRFLALEEIAKSIRSRVAMLRKGETPEALGLGEDLSPPSAEQLLLVLHRRWCEDFKPRTSGRRTSVTPAQVCTGLPAMHYFMSGKPFRQPGEVRELTKAQREEIATFGRIATRHEEEHGQLQGFVLEDWTVRDESLGGLRMERPVDGGSGRFVQQQLVAVRPSDAKSFMLGVMRWLSVSQDSVLRAGIQVLPGVPQPIAIRATGLNAVSQSYVQALMLPAVAVLQSPITLVLPAGWYRPKRVIEVYSDKLEQILLTGLIERGTDFERVSFGAP